mmetsp:Transcript_26725/g.49046  ORF Transcript_26725/g.49046 Transcript_26725/m.49046 type:complete len:797 (+) Transcript_26725:39-2429(+)
MSTAVVCVWGSNTWGQCCIDQEEAPKQVQKPSCANRCIARVIHPATPILAVASGEAHSLFLTLHGDVYACGRRTEGQLGHQSNPKEVLVRVEALQDKRVLCIACGNNHSIAVCDKGRAYEWGLLLPTEDMTSNDSQQSMSRRSGLGKDFHEDLNERQRRIVAQSWQQYMNDSSELPQEALEDANAMAQAECRRAVVHTPRLCVGLESASVRVASCGYAHTVVATDEGILYSAGYGEKGQLGNGSRFPRGRFDFVQMPQKRRLKTNHDGGTACQPPGALACGLNHTCAITSPDGHLFTWGFGVFGQLGLGKDTKETCRPTLVNLPAPAIQVACGSNHTLVLASSGDLYHFGHRDAVGGSSNLTRLPEKKLGFTAFTLESSPGRVERIFAGGTGSFALIKNTGDDSETAQHNLRAWGYNQHCQLGRWDASLELLQPGPVAIPALLGTRLSCFGPGSKHCVAIMADPPCCVLPPTDGFPFFGHTQLLVALSGTPAFDIDVKVKQEGNAQAVLGAHRFILQLRCQQLAQRLVRNSSCGTRAWSLDLSMYSRPAIEALLEYLYTDFCRARPSVAVELRPVSQDLGLARLAAGIAAATESDSEAHGKRWVRTAAGRWQQVDLDESTMKDGHASSYNSDLQRMVLEDGMEASCPEEYVPLQLIDAETSHEVLVARVLLLTVAFFRGFLDGGFAETTVATSEGAEAITLRADNVAALCTALRLLATGNPDDLPKAPLELLALIVEAHRLELSDLLNMAETALASGLCAADVPEDVQMVVRRSAELYGLRKLIHKELTGESGTLT